MPPARTRSGVLPKPMLRCGGSACVKRTQMGCRVPGRRRAPCQPASPLFATWYPLQREVGWGRLGRRCAATDSRRAFWIFRSLQSDMLSIDHEFDYPPGCSVPGA